MEKDYYKVLGVKKDATTEEIATAYKKLALKYHPDRQAGKSDAEKKEAEEKFKECAEAAEILKDPDKRRNYDQFGSTVNSRGFGGGGMDPFEFFRNMHSGFGFDDDGFGGGFGFNMGGFNRHKADRNSGPENGSNVQTQVNVTFKESVFGCTKEFDFDLDEECPTCKGSGMEPGTEPKECRHCGGKGFTAQVRRMGPMMSQQITECPYCNGTGTEVTPCRECGGAKRIPGKRHVKLKIPAGFADGRQLRLKGLGRCGLRGGTSGDLYVTVNAAGSDLFERDGNDIAVTVFVSPVVASIGGKIDVPTPYGYRKVKLQPGTESGTRLRVSGAGIRCDGGQTGDMVLEIRIEPYRNMTDRQKKLLSELAETETESNFENMAETRRLATEFYS